MNCKNCGKKIYYKYCDTQCKNEYYHNTRLTDTQVNALSVLNERRGWVRLDYNSTIYGMEKRHAPLLMVRNADEFCCDVHILPHGEHFLKHHLEK